MVQRQAREHSPDTIVPTGRGRAAEGWQEQHPLGSGRHLCRLVEQVFLRDPENGGGKPQGAAPGDEAGVLDQPRTVNGVSMCLDESLRVKDEVSRHSGHRLRGPGHVGDSARQRRTGAQRRRVLVARSDHYPAVRCQAEPLGRSRAYVSGYLVRRPDLGQLSRIDARGCEHRLGPGAQADVVEQGRRGIRVVLGDHPGQPPEQIAPNRSHHRGRLVSLRLLIAQPHDLRSYVRSIGVETRCREHPVDAHGVRQCLGLRGSPAIEPDDAIAQRPPGAVDRHHPIDLTSEAQMRHCNRVQSRSRHQFSSDLLNAVLPGTRVLVGPSGSQIRHRAGSACHTQDLSLGRKQNALYALGSDIYADYVPQVDSFGQLWLHRCQGNHRSAQSRCKSPRRPDPRFRVQWGSMQRISTSDRLTLHA